jgi:hypothetical protein
VKLSSEEIRLILSALEFDRVGKWGDERHLAIEKLIKKIKRIKKEEVTA